MNLNIPFAVSVALHTLVFASVGLYWGGGGGVAEKTSEETPVELVTLDEGPPAVPAEASVPAEEPGETVKTAHVDPAPPPPEQTFEEPVPEEPVEEEPEETPEPEEAPVPEARAEAPEPPADPPVEKESEPLPERTQEAVKTAEAVEPAPTPPEPEAAAASAEQAEAHSGPRGPHPAAPRTAQAPARAHGNPEMLRALKEDFRSAVRRKIEAAKFYPGWARKRGYEGVVRVRFTVGPEGGVRGVEVIEACRCDVLNRAACEAIERAAPFDIPPEAFPGGELTMEVDMAYRLE